MEPILEFNLDNEIENSFKKFIINEYIHKRIDNRIVQRILKYMDKGIIVIGYSKPAFIRGLIKIKDNITSFFNSNINKMQVHTVGYYNAKTNQIYILLDHRDKIIPEYLNLHILYTVLHEVIHYNYINKLNRASKIMAPVSREFYYELIKNLNIWYPITVKPKLMSSFLNEYTDRMVRLFVNGKLRNLDFTNLAKDILDKWSIKDSFQKDKIINWIDYTYREVIFGEQSRLMYTDQFRNSFIIAYHKIFKPTTLLYKIEFQAVYFYQELLNKSEIFSVVAPGLHGDNIKRNYNTELSLFLI